jgi:hypothetical protein
LTFQKLPENSAEAERLKRRLPNYLLVDGELCRKSASGVLMRCILADEGTRLLVDFHAGLCGNHAVAKIIVGKAYRYGFYWPTAVSDTTDVVQKCVGCQLFARQAHVPAAELQTIPITWSFATWGLDIVGPFKVAKGEFTHIFVVIDKFTKWIEVKPVAKITAKMELTSSQKSSVIIVSLTGS